MTTSEKIEFVKANLLKANPTEPVSVSAGGFDLAGQFTSATVAAVMARNAEVRPEPPRTPTKVSGQFDPRQFGPVSVHSLFPDAGRGDFSDDRSNAADDGETSDSHRVGYASDLLNCEVSGESGPGCVHGDVDHVARAIDCLTNFAKDDAMRKKHLADAGRAHTVRFAS